MKNFPNDYKAFNHKYNNTATALRDFIDFRLIARPDQPFNSKDGVMQAGRGCRRCHLVHGKVILVYKLVGPQIQLLAIFEHDDIESYATMDTLRDQAAAMKPHEFLPYTQPEIVQLVPSMAPRRRTVTKRTQTAIFDIAAFGRERDLAEKLANHTPIPYVPRRPDGQPWATDENMFVIGSPPVEPPVVETEQQTHRRAWAHSVLRMRKAGTEWSLIRTTMRSRYLDEKTFHDTVVARYRAASAQERTRLRRHLLDTSAREAAKAAAQEKRKQEILSAISGVAATHENPGTALADAKALREARLRCEELEQAAATLRVQVQDMTGRLAATGHRVTQLEAEVAEEQKGRAAMLAASQNTGKPDAQAVQVALAEATLARNLAMHAKDQAEEARNAERESARAALVRMRNAEAELVTERAIKMAAQRACAAAQARVAELEAAPPPAADDTLLERERAERVRLEGMLDTAAERIRFLEANGVVHAAAATVPEVVDAPEQPEEEDVRIDNAGARIFRARREKGYSLQHVCDLVKVSPVLMTMWERNQLGVPRSYAGRLSEALSFDLADFEAHAGVVSTDATPAKPAGRTVAPPVLLERVEGDTVGERIGLRRKARKLSQMALASMTGVSGPCICNWENGRFKPGPDNIKKLAEALLMTPDMILTGQGRPVELAPTGKKRMVRLSSPKPVIIKRAKPQMAPWPVVTEAMAQVAAGD